jgi:hypothetical protein
MDLGNLLSLSQSNEDTECTSQSLFKISEEGSEYFSAQESSSHSRRSNHFFAQSRVSVPSGLSEHLPRDIMWNLADIVMTVVFEFHCESGLRLRFSFHVDFFQDRFKTLLQ